MASHLSPETRKAIIAEYKLDRYTNIQIASRYKTTAPTVRNILIEAGIYIPQRPGRKNASQKITIDTKELENDLSIHEESVTKVVAYGVKHGRNYQVHVTITTDEDEFID